MSKRKTSQLHRLKISHKKFKRALSSRLITLEEQLYNQFQGQQFYSRAVLALAQEGDEVDMWVIGALVFERQLRAEAKVLTQQLSIIRTSIN